MRQALPILITFMCINYLSANENMLNPFSKLRLQEMREAFELKSKNTVLMSLLAKNNDDLKILFNRDNTLEEVNINYELDDEGRSIFKISSSDKTKFFGQMKFFYNVDYQTASIWSLEVSSWAYKRGYDLLLMSLLHEFLMTNGCDNCELVYTYIPSDKSAQRTKRLFIKVFGIASMVKSVSKSGDFVEISSNLPIARELTFSSLISFCRSIIGLPKKIQ